MSRKPKMGKKQTGAVSKLKGGPMKDDGSPQGKEPAGEERTKRKGRGK